MTNAQKDDDHTFKMPAPAEVGQAIMDAYEKAQPLLEQYLSKLSNPETIKELSSVNFDPLNVQQSYIDFVDKVIQEPDKFMEIQAGYMKDWMNLWQDSLSQFMGGAQDNAPQDYDRRFKAEEWNESAVFNFIKQSYLLTCKHIETTLDSVEISEEQKKKLKFQSKLFSDALSPTNFAMTNPDVLNETVKTGGQNLVKGFENLLNDLGRGNGGLNISTTNYDAFELGKNIAVTKGSVVCQNDLMQLIQYAPKTDKTFKTPLLIIPPWINKYYILDLREGNSLVEWLVEQGHTVFMISWVNPDAELAQKKFEDYMQSGILDALLHIEQTTGETECNAIGYCLGGTLLTSTMAYLTKKNQSNRIKSATFLTTLLDFEHAGDMKLFLDDTQLDKIDKMMEKHGVLDGKELQQTFSLMRANDLIWSFVVNNYLMGREPFPFDLLYWNDDSTNMPAAMQHYYLRNMYRDNKLIEADSLQMLGENIDIRNINTPCHFISTKEDHIAPWKATYAGAKILGDNVTFTLAASGHIAGVVNSPVKNKYCYWVNDTIVNDEDKWFEGAKQHEGSWWPEWQRWANAYTGEKVEARKVKKELEPAPGSYVKKRI